MQDKKDWKYWEILEGAKGHLSLTYDPIRLVNNHSIFVCNSISRFCRYKDISGDVVRGLLEYINKELQGHLTYPCFLIDTGIISEEEYGTEEGREHVQQLRHLWIDSMQQEFKEKDM